MTKLASRFVVAVLVAAAFLTGSIANAGMLLFQPIDVPAGDGLPVVTVQNSRAKGTQAAARGGGYVQDGKRYNAAGQYLGPAESSAKQAKKK